MVDDVMVKTYIFLFLGGGKGRGGGEGRGGEPSHHPPEGGGRSPPPSDFNGFFTQGRLIWNIFIFLSVFILQNLCNLP